MPSSRVSEDSYSVLIYTKKKFLKKKKKKESLGILLKQLVFNHQNTSFPRALRA
jgi:hypothetical protein